MFDAKIVIPVVVTALLTWLLSGLRERAIYKRKNRKEKLEKLEKLYAKRLTEFEMAIRVTERGDSHKDLENEIAETNSMLTLLGTKEVNEQSEKVSDLLAAWSSKYRQGKPQKSNGGSTLLFTAGADKFTDEANEIYPDLHNSILKLNEIMKLHIDNF